MEGKIDGRKIIQTKTYLLGRWSVYFSLHCMIRKLQSIMFRVKYTNIVGEYGQAVIVTACNKMDVIIG